jgi:hypothetical protein
MISMRVKPGEEEWGMEHGAGGLGRQERDRAFGHILRLAHKEPSPGPSLPPEDRREGGE